jgi:hypothetical protein
VLKAATAEKRLQRQAKLLEKQQLKTVHLQVQAAVRRQYHTMLCSFSLSACMRVCVESN